MNMLIGFGIGVLVTTVIAFIIFAVIGGEAEFKAYQQGYSDCEKGLPMKHDLVEEEIDDVS